MIRSATTIKVKRNHKGQQTTQKQPSYDSNIKKPLTSLKKNRSHSSFKISISKNPNLTSKQLLPKKEEGPIIGIKIKKKTEKEESISKKSVSFSKMSKPMSPSKLSRNERSSGIAPTSLITNRSTKPIPEQILEYIDKRADVQIVEHFEEYKKQFYTKSKILQTFIYESDEPQKIKNTYLNETDSHFRNGLQANMLKLFRSGVIVPQSYSNLRIDAVEEIEKWVIGWIHRKISYGKFAEEQEAQSAVVQESLKQLEDYKRMIDSQDTSF